MRRRQGQGTTDTGYSACQGPQHPADSFPPPWGGCEVPAWACGNKQRWLLGRGRFRGG